MNIERIAQKARDHITVVQKDVGAAVVVCTILRAGSEDEILEAINGKATGIARCILAVQHALAVTAVISIRRAHDDSKDAASLPNIFRLLSDARVREAAGRSSNAEAQFAKAEELWGKLDRSVGLGGLEYGIRTGHPINLSKGIKKIRDWTIAHSIPESVKTGPKFYGRDLYEFVDHSAQIVDALGHATETAAGSINERKQLWPKWSMEFWRHQVEATMPE